MANMLDTSCARTPILLSLPRHGGPFDTPMFAHCMVNFSNVLSTYLKRLYDHDMMYSSESFIFEHCFSSARTRLIALHTHPQLGVTGSH